MTSRLPADSGQKFEQVDVKPDYLKRLAELVDLPAIKKSGLKVVFDPFWGAARGYSCHILREHGVETATVHDYRDVLFGGHAPEPDDHLLGDCKKKMKETGAAIGIATDGDADRFGIVDADGTFIQPNYLIALLFDYLVETRGWKQRRRQIRRDHQPHQRARRPLQHSSLRDAGRLQIHR